MIDARTNEPLKVLSGGDAGPYIIIPVEQVEGVRILLDDNKVSYWVDEDAIRLDREPELTVINLGHNVDAEFVQNILDNAS